jgi:hypothetical protein
MPWWAGRGGAGRGVPASIGVFSDAVNRVMSFGSEGRFVSSHKKRSRSASVLAAAQRMNGDGFRHCARGAVRTDRRPQQELVPPLVDRHAIRRKHLCTIRARARPVRPPASCQVLLAVCHTRHGARTRQLLRMRATTCCNQARRTVR